MDSGGGAGENIDRIQSSSQASQKDVRQETGVDWGKEFLHAMAA